ncbi:hypothetical protein [Clostridium cavendishii]|nr:hypothetical protein [Clostridium cavendishii]
MISCDNKESKDVQSKVNKYLNETYGEEFVVGDLTKHSNEGFSGKYYYGQAYKKSNPDMKFDVQWDVGNPGKYIDSYLEKKWSKQGTEELKKILKEIYGQDIWVYFVLNKKEDQEYINCDYKEVISKAHGDVYFELAYYIPCEGNLDKKKEVENLNKIIEPYIKNNGMEIFTFRVYYLKSEYKDEVLKDLEKKKSHYVKLDKLYNEKKLINAVYLDKLNEVINKEDIVKKFKY